MTTMSYIEITGGVRMPLVGFGTDGLGDKLESSLQAALDAGYSAIDTAFVYNNEDRIGKVLDANIAAGKLNRSDLFIITKLPGFAHDKQTLLEIFERQLKALRTDYIDLYLIHDPCSCTRKKEDGRFVDQGDRKTEAPVNHVETWKVLEGLQIAGKVRSIGLSNFNEQQIAAICEHATIRPANLQIECHLLFQQKDLIRFCKEMGISVTAYAPLGSPGRREDGNALTLPFITDISSRLNRTPGQVLLRYLVQSGIAVIPKSANQNRIIENLQLFDFELSAVEEARMISAPQGRRLFPLEFLFGHPRYPFSDVSQTSK